MEQSRDKPLHISRRKWVMLALAVSLYSMILVFVYFIVTTASQGSMDPTPDNIMFYSVFFSIPFGLGLYPLAMNIKSKKIEFYQDYVRVFLGGKRGVKEVPYSQLRLGTPRLRIVSVDASVFFKIFLTDENCSFDVREVKLRRLGTYLYSWLKTKTP